MKRNVTNCNKIIWNETKQCKIILKQEQISNRARNTTEKTQLRQTRRRGRYASHGDKGRTALASTQPVNMISTERARATDSIQQTAARLQLIQSLIWPSLRTATRSAARGGQHARHLRDWKGIPLWGVRKRGYRQRFPSDNLCATAADAVQKNSEPKSFGILNF